MRHLLRRVTLGASALLAFLTASPAIANGDTTATILRIFTYEQGKHYALIQLTVPPAGTRATCATNTVYAGAIDLSSSSGQAQFALLLTAQAMGREVRVFGVGDITGGGCTLYSPVENVSFVYMIEP